MTLNELIEKALSLKEKSGDERDRKTRPEDIPADALEGVRQAKNHEFVEGPDLEADAAEFG